MQGFLSGFSSGLQSFYSISTGKLKIIVQLFTGYEAWLLVKDLSKSRAFHYNQL